MGINETIAANLSAWMAKHASLTTLEKVSSRSGVGFGTVRRVKNGDGNPTIKNLTDIAAAFGRTVDELIRPASAGYKPSGKVTELQAREPDPLPAPLSELVTTAQAMSAEGQYVLLGRAQELALRYPKAKANSGN